MRKILISAVLLASAAAAAPAAAQYQDYGRGYGYNQGQHIGQQLRNLSQRIGNLYQRRLISPREANRLQREVSRIDRLYDRYRYNGLSRGEHHDLQNRIQHLRQQIRAERQEGRWDRREDRRDDRWDERRDRRDDRRDRWDDRDDDRDDRWDD